MQIVLPCVRSLGQLPFMLLSKRMANVWRERDFSTSTCSASHKQNFPMQFSLFKPEAHFMNITYLMFHCVQEHVFRCMKVQECIVISMLFLINIRLKTDSSVTCKPSIASLSMLGVNLEACLKVKLLQSMVKTNPFTCSSGSSIIASRESKIARRISTKVYLQINTSI